MQRWKAAGIDGVIMILGTIYLVWIAADFRKLLPNVWFYDEALISTAMTESAVTYLDANATTPLHPEVLAAMLPLLRDNFANPSSVHGPGQAARAALDAAREQCAAALGCGNGCPSARETPALDHAA